MSLGFCDFFRLQAAPQMNFFKRLFFFFTFVFILSPICAQDNSSRPVDDFLFKIAVIGPSDEVFIWWGHAALIVENTRRNYSRVFDWGIFTYPGDSFLYNFVHERVRYKCTVGGLDLESYIKEDRDVTVYTLDLDSEAKEKILAYAENNVLAENCFYDYHEFRDNCSTRIRDIIDMGIGGQLKAAFGNVEGRFTTREQVRRFTWSRPFSDWLLGFLMGQNLDEKLTVWDEMFLPVEVARNIAGFKYTDNSGTEHRLVKSAEIIYSSKKRQPVLNAPLTTWPSALIAGLIFAALILLIKKMGEKHARAGRILLGASHALAGLLLGCSGSVLVFGFSMNNDYFQQNVNALFANPLLLAAIPLGIMFALQKPSGINSGKYLRIIWTYVFIACGITALLRILPFFYQQNQSVQGIVLPVAFVLGDIPKTIRAIKSRFVNKTRLRDA